MSKSIHIADEQVLAGLRSSRSKEDRYLKYLYQQHLPKVIQFVLTHNGNEADARDVFQDGMVVFYKNVKAGKFRGESTISTYIFAICKFLWFKKSKKESRYVEYTLPERAAIGENPHLKIVNEERQQIVLKLFGKMGKRCKELLILTLYQNFSMKEVAELMGFKNEQNARNKKYKCIKQLKKLLKNNKVVRGLLREIA